MELEEKKQLYLRKMKECIMNTDEGHGLILKTTGDVLIVVIVMGPGFSSLGGKKCIKNKSLEKARPHRYSIGGRVDKSYHRLQTYLFYELSVYCRESF
jgi:hypothetical protein